MNLSLPTPPALDELLQALGRPGAVMELAVAVAVLVVAWLMVRLMRGKAPRPGSVWFGEHVIDGVLFPVLALCLGVAAQHVLLASGLSLAVFRVVIPVLVSLLLIRLAARVLKAAFPASGWVRAVERSLSWLAWIAVVLWVTGLMPALLAEMDGVHWRLGKADVSLRTLLDGALGAAVVLVLALWVSAAIERKLLAPPVQDLSLRKIAANLVRAALLFFGLMLALSAAGIDLTALSVLGGALGVGLGFGLQKLAANYVSGFVILAERSLRIGDVVRVDGFEGRITDIATRYTVIRAINGREAIVPNEMLITQRIENYSLADPRVLVTTTVQVAYGTDLDGLLPALVEAVLAVPRVLADPGPAVQLASFGADGLDLQIIFWINDPENGSGGVKSDANLAILAVLTARAVEIPFPQRVMHLPAGAAPQRPDPSPAPWSAQPPDPAG
ncbi:MAG: mechanosensitive ion channel domain-containing protein [Burkholderiales bacterium]